MSSERCCRTARPRRRASNRATRSCPWPDRRLAISMTSRPSCSTARARRCQLRFKRGDEVRQVAVRLAVGRCRRSVRPQDRSAACWRLARVAFRSRARCPMPRSTTWVHHALDRGRNCRNGSRAASPRRKSAGRSGLPRSRGRALRSAFCRSSSWSRCSQLISDSSTSCQSRCWMEAICFSMAWRQSGAVRSALTRSNGRSERAGAHSRVGALHDGQRFGLAWAMGAASALDWLGRLGQGSNRGFSAKCAVAPFRTQGGDE